jgi:glycosyltransferase involved in cell wall biosynthesis
VLRKYDPAAWGGVETHLVALTRALSRLGVGCEVHAPLGPTTPDKALAARVPLVRYRARLPVIGPASKRRALWECGGNLVSAQELFRLAKDSSLSLAHVHTQGRVGGAVRTAMKLTGRPYVVSVHGPLRSGAEFVEHESRRRLRGVRDVGQPFGLLVGARRVLEDAARILVFNDEEAAALEARHGARVVRLDQGVELDRFASGDADRGRERAGTKRPFVLQVGRLCRQKNAELSLAAFARAAPRGHDLVFAGAETDPGLRSKLEAQARAAGIAERVRWLGNVEPTEIPDLLAASELVLAPSLHEAFGLVVLEAWAASRPVLFAGVAGMADLGRGLQTTPAVPHHDAEGWARLLGDWLRSPSALREAAREGEERARSRFDWNIVARRHAALYDEVRAEARARRRLSTATR